MDLNIDEELDRIITDYDLYRDNSEIKNRLIIKKTIIDLFASFKPTDKIAIKGAGNNAAYILSLLDDQTLKQVSCFIDRNYSDTFFGFPVFNSDQVDYGCIDYIVISSIRYNNEMIDDVISSSNNSFIKIVSLYDKILENHGVPSEDLYYDYNLCVDSIKSEYDLYNSCDNNSQKAMHLRRRIGFLLEIRDIFSVLELIDEYIVNKYDFFTEYKRASLAIRDFCNDIKQSLKQREGIIINWIDGLSPDFAIERIPYFRSIVRRCILFRDAFSTSPYTRASFKTMFTGGKLIDDELYKVNRIDETNSALLRWVMQEEIELRYVGIYKYSSMLNRSFVSGTAMQVPCLSMVFWNALKILGSGNRFKVIILHSIDIHDVFRGPGVKKWPENRHNEDYLTGFDEFCTYEQDFKEAFFENLNYASSLFEFYESILGNRLSKIYMSDHGTFGHKNEYYKDSVTRILMMIDDEEEGKSITELYSHYDFYKLIRHVYNKNVLSFTSSTGYVLIQMDDMYDKKHIERVSNELTLDKLRGKLQFRCIRLGKETYVRYVDGHERYFINNNFDINEIDNHDYQSRIEQLRELNGNRFINVFADDKYKYSRYMYKKLGIDSL